MHWNTGALGGSGNHWLKVRLAGAPERRLVGAKILVRDAKSGKLLGRRDYFPSDSYKSSHGLEVHFGLGKQTRARVDVVLPDGRRFTSNRPAVDRTVTLHVGGSR